mmetsp:Transcript_21410/g.72530  ORF Transcript_21410/g.72530 Transcript_21410/m.72530 type:complete len:266 (-) Transcript_21410:368-1165(-)
MPHGTPGRRNVRSSPRQGHFRRLGVQGGRRGSAPGGRPRSRCGVAPRLTARRVFGDSFLRATRNALALPARLWRRRRLGARRARERPSGGDGVGAARVFIDQAQETRPGFTTGFAAQTHVRRRDVGSGRRVLRRGDYAGAEFQQAKTRGDGAAPRCPVRARPARGGTGHGAVQLRRASVVCTFGGFGGRGGGRLFEETARRAPVVARRGHPPRRHAHRAAGAAALGARRRHLPAGGRRVRALTESPKEVPPRGPRGQRLGRRGAV